MFSPANNCKDRAAGIKAALTRKRRAAVPNAIATQTEGGVVSGAHDITGNARLLQ